MSKRDELLLLQDIAEAGNKIIKYCEGLDFKRFLDDDKTMDACLRNFEIMGEAAKRISNETKNAHPQIEWRKISNYRNLLIHEYFGVNLEIVWDIIENELKETVDLVQEIINMTGK